MTTKITVFRMEAVRSLETFKNFYQTRGHHIHLDCNLQFLKFNSPAKAQPPVIILSELSTQNHRIYSGEIRHL